jgi:hypothetical protein
VFELFLFCILRSFDGLRVGRGNIAGDEGKRTYKRIFDMISLDRPRLHDDD